MDEMYEMDKIGCTLLFLGIAFCVYTLVDDLRTFGDAYVAEYKLDVDKKPDDTSTLLNESAILAKMQDAHLKSQADVLRAEYNIKAEAIAGTREEVERMREFKLMSGAACDRVLKTLDECQQANKGKLNHYLEIVAYAERAYVSARLEESAAKSQEAERLIAESKRVVKESNKKVIFK